MKRPYLFLFAAAAIWVLVAGFTLQFYVYPKLFAASYWGHGLVNGDWVYFHQLALKFAETSTLTHPNFSLAPLPRSPGYLLGILYLVTGVHEPWIFLFVNALSMGLGCVFIAKILKIFGLTAGVSAMAAALYIFTPSAVELYSQVHRDALAFLGIFIFIYVVLTWLFEKRSFDGRSILLYALSLLLITFFRPYLLYVTGFVLFLTGLWQIIIPVDFLRPRLRLVTILWVLGFLSFTTGHSIGQIASLDANLQDSSRQSLANCEPQNIFDRLFPNFIRRQVCCVQIARDNMVKQTDGPASFLQMNSYTDLQLATPTRLLFSLPTLFKMSLVEPLDFLLTKKPKMTVFDRLALVENGLQLVLILFLFGVAISQKNRPLLYTILTCLIFAMISASGAVNITVLRRMKIGYVTLLAAAGLGFALQIIQRRQGAGTRRSEDQINVAS